MTVTVPPAPHAPSEADVRVLFEEARRRRRLRWRRVVVVVLALCLAVAALLVSRGSPKNPVRPVLRPTPGQPRLLRPFPAVVPREPGPLAMGPNGDLYLADDALNEILVRLPGGVFQVLAGDGTAGYSGDGGPALEAQVSRPLGIAVGSDGTVYFADSGNSRVRAVLPDGIITTVAGNGQPPAESGNIAVDASSPTATAVGPVDAVTMGPHGSLYIAASNDVLALSAAGVLSAVADAPNFHDVDHAHPGMSECDPDGLAFDGSGDLFMTCANWNDLLERTVTGSFVYRGILRPHDASAALTSSPDGSVIGLWQSAMYRFTPATQQVLHDFTTVPGVGDFWPQGVAVAPDGTIYTDQDGISGIGPAAIVTSSPRGVVTAVWPAPGRGQGENHVVRRR